MLEISGGLDIIDDQLVSYTKTLDRVLGQIIREAARRWLRAVLTSVPSRGGFPVITGAAISTLKPLGRMLRVAIDTTPRPGPDDRYRGDRRELGESSQAFSLVSNGFVYTFSWQTDLEHYVLNEDNAIATVRSSPWNSLEAGNAAFQAFLDEALERRLPKIEDYIQVRIARG